MNSIRSVYPTFLMGQLLGIKNCKESEVVNELKLSEFVVYVIFVLYVKIFFAQRFL